MPKAVAGLNGPSSSFISVSPKGKTLNAMISCPDVLILLSSGKAQPETNKMKNAERINNSLCLFIIHDVNL